MPSYSWYRMQAVIKLSKDRERGPAYQPVLDLGEEILREHVTLDKQVGSPCVACGEPWPCKMFNSIHAMD